MYCWWSALQVLTGGGAAWKTEHPHHEHHGVHVGDEAVAPHVRHLSEHEPSHQVRPMQLVSELTTSNNSEQHVCGVGCRKCGCYAHMLSRGPQWLIFLMRRRRQAVRWICCERYLEISAAPSSWCPCNAMSPEFVCELQDSLHHEPFADAGNYHKMAERDDSMQHHLHVRETGTLFQAKCYVRVCMPARSSRRCHSLAGVTWAAGEGPHKAAVPAD